MIALFKFKNGISAERVHTHSLCTATLFTCTRTPTFFGTCRAHSQRAVRGSVMNEKGGGNRSFPNRMHACASLLMRVREGGGGGGQGMRLRMVLACVCGGGGGRGGGRTGGWRRAPFSQTPLTTVAPQSMPGVVCGRGAGGSVAGRAGWLFRVVPVWEVPPVALPNVWVREVQSRSVP